MSLVNWGFTGDLTRLKCRHYEALFFVHGRLALRVVVFGRHVFNLLLCGSNLRKTVQLPNFSQLICVIDWSFQNVLGKFIHVFFIFS